MSAQVNTLLQYPPPFACCDVWSLSQEKPHPIPLTPMDMEAPDAGASRTLTFRL